MLRLRSAAPVLLVLAGAAGGHGARAPADARAGPAATAEPPADAGPSAGPSAADRAADFELRYQGGNGLSGATWGTVITGDVHGARVEHLGFYGFRRGHPPVWQVETLDARAVKALLDALDALAPWALGDASENGMDLSWHAVALRRGSFTHAFHVYGDCACRQIIDDDQRPGDKPCPCPQDDLIERLEAVHGAPLPVAAATEHAFQPGPLEGSPWPARCARRGPLIDCNGKRCFEVGGGLSCYASPRPGDPAERVVPTWSQEPEEGEEGEVRPNWFWMLELEDGRTCVASRLSLWSSGWRCNDRSRVLAAFPAGPGWVAVVEEEAPEAFGGWRRHGVQVKGFWR
jgi:hypothetical protein